MKGVVYVKVAVYFELDLSDEQIDEVISEVDYDFKHNLISHTEIKGVEE
jgi:hypothetical protein